MQKRFPKEAGLLPSTGFDEAGLWDLGLTKVAITFGGPSKGFRVEEGLPELLGVVHGV